MSPVASIADSREAQMLPQLEPAEIDRLRRFGEVCRYKAGDMVVRAGQVAPGLQIVLSGQVRITAHESGHALIVVYERGAFMGELAQLSGRPALVDGEALSDVEAIVIPPARLRELMVAEAEIGEHIMRALILRRVRLLDQRVGGPTIIGTAPTIATCCGWRISSTATAIPFTASIP